MKAAQVSDTWRKALARPYKPFYKHISYAGITKLGSGQVSFTPGLTAMVGGNGVGKSTLMSAVLRSLGPLGQEHMTYTLGPTAGVDIAGTVIDINEHELKTALENDGVSVTPAKSVLPPYEWIDPSTYASDIRKTILADKNFRDNLEGIDPQKFSEEECESISYIVGRKYERIEAYEIEDIEELGTVPFFQVKVEDVEYDTVGMGLGELSLLLIYWRLRRLQQETIVLIEEPETHVSPRAQEHLMDVCMSICHKKGVSIIVTTHSPFLISRMPMDRLRLLVRKGASVQIIVEPTHDQVAKVLGDRLTYHGAILVEDEMARCTARALLRQCAPELLEYFEILNADSDSGIVAGLKGLPRAKSWFSLVGLFDGDRRAAQSEKNYAWPHFFLPTDQCPEQLLRQTIETQRAAAIQSIGCTEEEMDVACEAAAGEEIHGWVQVVRQSLSVDMQTFCDRVLVVWLQDQENRQLVESLVKELRKVAFLYQVGE